MIQRPLLAGGLGAWIPVAAFLFLGAISLALLEVDYHSRRTTVEGALVRLDNLSQARIRMTEAELTLYRSRETASPADVGRALVQLDEAVHLIDDWLEGRGSRVELQATPPDRDKLELGRSLRAILEELRYELAEGGLAADPVALRVLFNKADRAASAVESSTYRRLRTRFEAETRRHQILLAGGAAFILLTGLGAGVVIRARGQAERDRHQTEERYAVLSSLAPVGIVRCEQGGEVTAANPWWTEVTTRSGDDWKGLPWWNAVTAERRDEVAAEWRERTDRGEPFSQEVSLGEGSSLSWTVARWSPTRPGDPARAQWVGTFTDVTDRKDIETQLRQAQKMEAVGRLAGGIAHDFNNALTAIQGYGELLLPSTDPGSPERSDLAEILKAANHAKSLTQQLLTFSRRQVTRPEVVDLCAVVRDTEKMLRRVIGEDVRLETQLSAEPCRVRVDRGHLEQVLLNLAVNARDAMPGGGRLTLRTVPAALEEARAHEHPLMEPGSYCLLEVVDTGHGMTDEVRQKIFEPFFTTKEAGKGTGLGLSTVYGIVKQAGGSIWCYSEPDQGTSFEIYLPAAAAAPPAPEETPAPRTARSPSAGSETVLLVEDEAAVRRLARRTLDSLGYRVLEAGDGEEALAVARRHSGPIDLLLTDVVMPRLGGRDLARQLAELHPDLEVLFMSGYAESHLAFQGSLEEDVALIEKPFGPLELAEKLREVLDRGSEKG